MPQASLAAAAPQVPTEAQIQGFLDGRSGKLVVFTDSRATLKRLHALFPFAAVLSPIDTATMRQGALQRFRADKGCRVLLADLKLGAIGVDLSNASAMIFDLAYDQDPALLLQARGRLHRPSADSSSQQRPSA